MQDQDLNDVINLIFKRDTKLQAQLREYHRRTYDDVNHRFYILCTLQWKISQSDIRARFENDRQIGATLHKDDRYTTLFLKFHPWTPKICAVVGYYKTLLDQIDKGLWGRIYDIFYKNHRPSYDPPGRIDLLLLLFLIRGLKQLNISIMSGQEKQKEKQLAIIMSAESLEVALEILKQDWTKYCKQHDIQWIKQWIAIVIWRRNPKRQKQLSSSQILSHRGQGTNPILSRCPQQYKKFVNDLDLDMNADIRYLLQNKPIPSDVSCQKLSSVIANKIKSRASTLKSLSLLPKQTLLSFLSPSTVEVLKDFNKGQIMDLLSDMDPELINLVIQQLGTRQFIIPVFQYIRDKYIKDAFRISILAKMIQVLKSPPTKTDLLWDSILTGDLDSKKVEAFLSSCKQSQLEPTIIRNLLQTVCLPTSFRYTSVDDINNILRVFHDGHSEDTYYSCQYHVKQKQNQTDTRRIDLFITLLKRPPIMIHFQIVTHYLTSKTSVTKSFLFVLRKSKTGCIVRLIPTHSQSRYRLDLNLLDTADAFFLPLTQSYDTMNNYVSIIPNYIVNILYVTIPSLLSGMRPDVVISTEKSVYEALLGVAMSYIEEKIKTIAGVMPMIKQILWILLYAMFPSDQEMSLPIQQSTIQSVKIEDHTSWWRRFWWGETQIYQIPSSSITSNKQQLKKILPDRQSSHIQKDDTQRIWRVGLNKQQARIFEKSSHMPIDCSLFQYYQENIYLCTSPTRICKYDITTKYNNIEYKGNAYAFSISQMNMSQKNVTILRKTQIFLEAYMGEPIGSPPKQKSPKKSTESSPPPRSNFLLRFSIEQGDAVYSSLNPDTHMSIVLPIFYYPNNSDPFAIYSDVIKKIVTPPKDYKIRGQILREMIGLNTDKEFNPLFGFDFINYFKNMTSLNIQSMAILIFNLFNEISYFIVYLMKKTRIIHKQNRPNILSLLYTSLTRSIPTSMLDANMQKLLDKLLEYLKLYDILFGIVHILIILIIVVPGSKKPLNSGL